MQEHDSLRWPLGKLLEGWVNVQINHSDTSITGLSLDSRSASQGDLFFALQGLQQHGVEYSQHAMANGATALVWESSKEVKEEVLPHGIPCIELEGLHSKLGLICKRFYNNPSARINVIAVTGTDGKTSVSQFIAQTFNQLNVPCGVVGTLGYGVYPKFDDASHTTPDAVHMHGLLYGFNVDGVSNVVLEASSHGLSQGRLQGVEVNTAVFTNLGRDHMDYHKSYDDYFNAKKLLFQFSNLKNAVINVDDEAGARLVDEFSNSLNVVTYSIKSDAIKSDSYVNALNIEYAGGKTSFKVESSWGKADVKTKLFGKFNISNLLAVMGSLLVSGVKFDDAVNAISFVNTVPGRMEFVSNGRDSSNANSPAVVVDYAHTPQALINVLKVLREHCDGKLWCVFGCGGDRDQGKRKLMAEAVEQYADWAVITDDNPRNEDPEIITNEIESGFLSTKYSLIHDRKLAIEYAVKHAGHEDIVLIAGKGHEAVQIVKHEHLPFDDKKVASEFLG
ncbi:MAG: UDP-N-acetylmuramoyl-L-alanyl-D-glutamate--2,6-diaminopimelate ligase [Gammaproteobacteria bacterium]